MTQLRAHWTGLTLSVVLSVACSVQAQTGDLGQSPTFSPWFGLYQRNGGPLDNYHTFVRPKIELANTLQGQQAAIQRNTAGINSLGQDVQQLQEPGTVRPTGTGSVFMNYSHYYGTQATGPQVVQHSTTRRVATRMPMPPPGHAMH
jgi:hypothetical protein